MKHKPVVTILVSMFLIFLCSNLLQAELTSGPGDDPSEQEADSVAERVIGRPVPVMQPNPADKNALKAIGKDTRTSNMNTTNGASRSMGTPPRGGPGSPVMNSGKMLKPAVIKNADTKGSMPTALQQRQQIKQKLSALGFQVGQLVPDGQGKWTVQVQKNKVATGKVMDDGEHGDATLSVGFTNSGAMSIGAVGLKSTGLNVNADQLQANGIIIQ